MSSLQLPYNLDAERAVIASLFLRADTLDLYGLQPADFYILSHEQIYAAALAVRNHLTLFTIADELRRRDQLDAVGGRDALNDYQTAYWTPSYETEHCVEIVRECATRRQLILAGGRIAALGYDELRELDEQVGEAHTLLTQATSGGLRTSAIQIAESLPDWYAMVTSTDSEGIRYRTGLHDLDRASGGVWVSDLTTLAAATSVGKTALALTVADHISQEATVLWFSMEMPREQLINRLVAMHTGLDAHALRMRKIARHEMPMITQAMDELAKQDLTIDATPERTLAQIRTTAQQHRARRGTMGLVVIDHLGLIKSSGRYAGQRVHEIGELSRGLKALAMDIGSPVLALHQFSREGAAERDPDRVPMLSDMRDSGNVEQDSDNVWLLHRPNKGEKTTLYIAKQRNGPLAKIALQYEMRTTRFVSSAPDYRGVNGYDND